MTIRPLAYTPKVVSLLACWFHGEWHDFDRRSLTDIKTQLTENLTRDSIPITFLAHSGSTVVGTVSLDLTDLPAFDHLSPWLASLYVLPAARGAGIGTALVSHDQEFAVHRGIRRIHLWTHRSTRLYENCGWTVFAHTTYNSRQITIMHFAPWENSTNR